MYRKFLQRIDAEGLDSTFRALSEKARTLPGIDDCARAKSCFAKQGKPRRFRKHAHAMSIAQRARSVRIRESQVKIDVDRARVFRQRMRDLDIS